MRSVFVQPDTTDPDGESRAWHIAITAHVVITLRSATRLTGVRLEFTACMSFILRQWRNQDSEGRGDSKAGQGWGKVQAVSFCVAENLARLKVAQFCGLPPHLSPNPLVCLLPCR